MPRLSRWLLTAMLLAGWSASARNPAPSSRELFNQAAQALEASDYSRAESLLHSVLTRNDERTQSPALYNLGLARFAFGAEALQKGPDARAVGRRARTASVQADGAMRDAFEALRRDEQQALLSAYLRGRGVRREIREARRALALAIEAHRDVLAKWQRASGDFHSAAELNPADADAAHNAEVADRYIAQLVDMIQQMLSMMEGLGDQADGLREVLSEMRGRLPEGLQDPGSGDEEGDEDSCEGPQPGMQEGRGRDGRERPVSPEIARQLLEGFQLDRERQLPMGFEREDARDDRPRRNW